MMKEQMPESYTYKIDDKDTVYYVSDNWQSFVTENSGASNTDSVNVIGKSLWDYIYGSEARHLYEIIIKRVRRSKWEITLMFRCDSPDLRRYLQLIIKPLADNHIEFISQVIRTESRQSVDLLRSDIDRSEELITLCFMCKKLKIDENTWEELESGINTLKLFHHERLPKISHGLCPTCYQMALEQFAKNKR
jgi:hypothetical protein